MVLSNVAKIGIAAFGKLTGANGGGLRNQNVNNTSKMITGYKEKSEYVSKNGITSSVYLMDCMEGMKQLQSNENILAVVDPPYGIDRNSMNMGNSVFNTDNKKWDKDIPNDLYFKELFRVSKNQIIWGGNYFPLPNSQYFTIWDKGETMYGRDFAECEYAWVRSGGTRIYKKNPNQPERIHPTQKPVALYDWIFNKYAKPTDTILDTHLGSGSSRIAAERAGLNFIGFELDVDYYQAQEKRFKNHVSQLTLF